MVQNINIQTSIDLLDELAGQILQTASGIVQPGREDPSTVAIAIREPLGVQVGIAPWNAALLLGLRAVATPYRLRKHGNPEGIRAEPISAPFHRQALLGRRISKRCP